MTLQSRAHEASRKRGTSFGYPELQMLEEMVAPMAAASLDGGLRDLGSNTERQPGVLAPSAGLDLSRKRTAPWSVV